MNVMRIAAAAAITTGLLALGSGVAHADDRLVVEGLVQSNAQGEVGPGGGVSPKRCLLEGSPCTVCKCRLRDRNSPKCPLSQLGYSGGLREH